MSEKPKRIISDEQRAKMIEGRKRAMEERKRKREEEKTKSKAIAEKKKADKDKELELELQALRQQKDHAESKKKTMEHRKNFRDKIRREEELKKFKESQEEQMKIDYKEEQRYAKEAIKDEVEEEIEDDVTQEELDFLEEYGRKEQAEQNIQIHVEEPVHDHEHKSEQEIDPMEEKIFKAQVQALSTGKGKETKKLFEKITENYDKKKSITDNLNSMASEIKELIKNNTKQIKKNEKVVEKKKKVDKKVNHFDVEDVPIEVLKEEQKYKSKLNNLMRLR